MTTWRGVRAPLLGGLLGLLAAPCMAQDLYVDFWMRSFIGNEHPTIPGYMGKADNGLFTIPAPNIKTLGLLELEKLSGTCFVTDQRDSFSDKLDESARVGIYLRIRIKGREIVAVDQIGSKPKIVVGLTRNVDCKTGADLQPGRRADASDTTITDVKEGDGFRVFSVRISAGDPFYTILGFKVAPRVDSEILFTYYAPTRRLVIKGTLESFPWYEAYYRIQGEAVKRVITSEPAEKADANSLFDFGTGINLRNYSQTIELLPYVGKKL